MAARFLVTKLHWSRRASLCHAVLTDEDTAVEEVKDELCLHRVLFELGVKKEAAAPQAHPACAGLAGEHMGGKVNPQAVPCNRGLWSHG